MADDAQTEVAALLAPMLKKAFFAAINIAVATSDEMLPHAAEHLRYMDDLEQRGLLFASGPFVREGVAVGDGLTILRTATIEDARRLMEDEPLIRRGLRRFDLHRWELREGRITVNLHASRSAFDLA